MSILAILVAVAVAWLFVMAVLTPLLMMAAEAAHRFLHR